MSDAGRTANRRGHEGAAAYYRAVLLAVSAGGLVLQIAALGPLRDSFWGVHLFAFLPRSAMVLAWAAVAAAALAWLVRGWRWQTAGADRPSVGVPALVALALAAAAAAVFWAARSGQTLLGDGLPLTIDLPGGQSFHPRQPLAMWLQHAVYQTFSAWFSGGGTIDGEVARNTVALGSVIAGAAFVAVVFFLGRSFPRGGRRGEVTGFLAASVILTQGYAVLFFGYVENYAYFALAVAVYLMLAAWVVQRRVPLWAPALALVAAIGVHLSAVALAPSFVYLVWHGAARRSLRRDALVGAVAFVAGLAALDALLGRLSPGFGLWNGLAQIAGVARRTQGGGAGWSYLFSPVHLRDFFNEQYLVGPLAAWLFAPALGLAVRRRSLGDPMAVFFSLAAGAFLVGSFATSEPLLGYARDWDLFAAAGVCYCAAGVYLLVSHVALPRYTRRLLAFALVVSLAHLAPWAAVNHSEEVSLERFETLPLGAGRTEVVVGNYYMRKHRPAQAERWFKRAVEQNPVNVNAYFLLGVLYASEGHAEAAVPLIARAVELRPDKADYRRRLVQVCIEAGRCRDAVPHLAWLARRQPGDFAYWQEVGRDMGRAGCGDALNDVCAPVLAEADRRLSENPRDTQACLYAGILLGYCGRPEEALERYRSVLEIDPRSAAGLFNAGITLMDLDRPAQARTYLEKFVSLYPDHRMSGLAREILSRE